MARLFLIGTNFKMNQTLRVPDFNWHESGVDSSVPPSITL
jgi:hypothetical protein